MSVPLQAHIGKDGFRLRGTELARIDAFSDVVFGFALTLLVVSLEVPKTYPELEEVLRGFFPFAVSFFLLMIIWYSHYRFFRRFGTHDLGTVAINGILLFFVLFYVYPLKFLFNFAVLGAIGHATPVFTAYGQIAHLMVIYGVGFFAIYALLSALYCNGYRQRAQLALNPLETFLSRTYIFESLGIGLIGLLSAIVALLLPANGLAGYAGFVYLLIWPFKRLSGSRNRKKALAIRTGLSQPSIP